jgi:signal transduction histidine kinase
MGVLSDRSSQALTAAVHRVEEHWRDARVHGVEVDDVGPLLAALLLAIGRRSPEYVTSLSPRPAPRVVHQVVERLGRELIRGWTDGGAPTSDVSVLGHLAALEQVRAALERIPPEDVRAPVGEPPDTNLLVGIVHDLRSPLTSILFLAETLQSGASGPVTALQHRQLGLIYSAALGLSALVSDALELARSGTQLVDDQPAPLSMAELLESVRDIVRPMAEEKGLSVRLLGPEPDGRLGHPLALSRTLLNLTTNAIKFTERGFVEITALARGPTRLELSVRDSGPGIDPKALAHLYRPLRPSVIPGRYRFSSTGLGLAISRRLVTAMGSELQLETRPGWGTRFFFEVELPPVRPE